MHFQQDVRCLLPGRHRDGAGGQAVLHPVEDGILHQGLQDHLGHGPTVQSTLGLYLEGGPPVVAELLDGDVALDQLHLPGHGGGALPGQGGPQQLAQLHHHPGGVLAAPGADHPVHGIQRVVQKMGVDLGLEHLVLGLLQQDLFFVVFPDQGVDLLQHDPELAGQLAGLVPVRVVGQHGQGGLKVVALHHLHRGAQPGQRPGDEPGQYPHHQAAHHKEGHEHPQHDEAKGWL